MNDFDRLLELQLRRMLDPVVATRPPQRRGQTKRSASPVLAVVPAPVELAVEAIPVIEPVVLPVAVPRLVS